MQGFFFSNPLIRFIQGRRLCAIYKAVPHSVGQLQQMNVGVMLKECHGGPRLSCGDYQRFADNGWKFQLLISNSARVLFNQPLLRVKVIFGMG